MQNRTRWIALLSFFAVTCTVYASVPRSPFPPTELSWIAEPWTGDDKPFTQAHAQINALVAAGKNPETLRQQYKASAQRNYYDALSQFRYGFAALHASLLLTSKKKQIEMMRDVSVALNAPASPRSYEYSRLRFLVEIQGEGINDPIKGDYIIDLGKRLALKNSRDYYVLVRLVPLLLSNSRSRYENTVLSLQLAKQYEKGYPKEPSSQLLLGDVYASRVYVTYNDSDAQRAISYYKKYISMVGDTPMTKHLKKIEIPLLQKKSYLRFRRQNG